VNNHITEKSTILDLGVGTGRYLGNFKKCKKMYGIDMMSDFIKVANKIKPKNCELFVDDIVDLQFNKPIDLIFTMTVLQHVHPEQIDVSIKNITQLGAKDIMLWESNHETYVYQPEFDYRWGHNFEEIFNKYNYSLHYKELYDNMTTWILHFKKI
tara:strand:- start:8529 stop:8993 length:465 start_codon:yes stop_codon:yes gene_type:complete